MFLFCRARIYDKSGLYLSRRRQKYLGDQAAGITPCRPRLLDVVVFEQSVRLLLGLGQALGDYGVDGRHPLASVAVLGAPPLAMMD